MLVIILDLFFRLIMFFFIFVIGRFVKNLMLCFLRFVVVCLIRLFGRIGRIFGFVLISFNLIFLWFMLYFFVRFGMILVSLLISLIFVKLFLLIRIVVLVLFFVWEYLCIWFLICWKILFVLVVDFNIMLFFLRSGMLK